MNDAVRDILRNQVLELGPSLLDDRRRVDNLLRDLAKDSPGERTAISQALDADAVHVLRPVVGTTRAALVKDQLVAKLARTYRLAEESARWAIEVLENVLELAQSLPPTLPKPRAPRGTSGGEVAADRDALVARLGQPGPGRFSAWVDALLNGMMPADGAVKAARSAGDPWTPVAAAAGCHGLPDPTGPVSRVRPVPPAASPGQSAVDIAREAFCAACGTGGPREIALAWMTLRALDVDALTDEERKTGETAVRDWGRRLAESSGGA